MELRFRAFHGEKVVFTGNATTVRTAKRVVRRAAIIALHTFGHRIRVGKPLQNQSNENRNRWPQTQTAVVAPSLLLQGPSLGEDCMTLRLQP